MDSQNASQTAIVASLIRAIHTRTDALVIHNDPWGDRLISSTAWERLYEFARLRNPNLPAAPGEATVRSVVTAGLRASVPYPNIIVRSRFAEDALHRAAARGINQYVLIGAGLDSYALREGFSNDMLIVEIDHPATQTLKRQLLARAKVALPVNAHLIPADLAVEDLHSVLKRSPLLQSKPTFFSWLGVTMYLSREANLKTLRAVASTASPGSEIVFEYIDESFFEHAPVRGSSANDLRQAVSALGEPFLSGFSPSSLQRDLASAGLDLLEDVSDAELVGRYDPDGKNRLSPHGLGRVALARIVGASDA